MFHFLFVDCNLDRSRHFYTVLFCTVTSVILVYIVVQIVFYIHCKFVLLIPYTDLLFDLFDNTLDAA